MLLRWVSIFTLLTNFVVSSASPFDYIYPINRSSHHKIETQIIIRTETPIDQQAIHALEQTSISGSLSGYHGYTTRIVENENTILLIPIHNFTPGETITVNFNAPFESSIQFEIESLASFLLPERNWKQFEELSVPEKDAPTFPEATVTQNGIVGAGVIYGTTASNENDLFILNNDGLPLFTQNTGTSTAQNFRYFNDTLCVYADVVGQFYLGLDTAFQVVDTFQCVNGFNTDFHEMLFTESGNAVMMSFDQQVVDMSQIVPGGHPAALITGVVLQEIDPDDNLIFQWRSWDHFEITDGQFQGVDSIDFTADQISYVHCNSIEIDNDGNWIISSRHMGEVTKISRTTGDLIWRLGGKHNDFTYIGDPLNGFNLQHDARRTPSGTLTVFDNGIFHSPRKTRIVEYELDETNMTATLIWQFENPYGDVTQISGNAQRLENGNTFINWGRRITSPPPSDFFLEVDSVGNHVFEMSFVTPGQMGWIYRAYRFPVKQDSLTTSTEVHSGEASVFKLFPTLASSFVNVEVQPLVGGVFDFKIFDAQGRLIKSEEIELAEATKNLISISIENLSSGVYFMAMQNELGTHNFRKFIKPE